MQLKREHGGGWSAVAGLWLLAWVAAAGCEVGGAAVADADAGSKQRTVSIELLRTAERRLEANAAGIVTYPAPKLLGGVEVCVMRRRPAFAILEPFSELTAPLCETNQAEQPVRLRDVPAGSDLLITYTKDGYLPLLTTFRTDEFDVALPSWGDNATYFTPLLREEANVPVESEPAARAGNGLVAVWVGAIGDYGSGTGGGAQFGAGSDPGTAPAEGVHVEIEDDAGELVTELQTRRDRPIFVSLPAGAYRLRFTHALMELVPAGVQEQSMTTGLPVDTMSEIEVAVAPDHLTLAMVDGYCPVPANAVAVFDDLSTCTLAVDSDAGVQ